MLTTNQVPFIPYGWLWKCQAFVVLSVIQHKSKLTI